MLELGLSYKEGPIFLKDIARKQEISEKYLSQIIIPLKAAGLINTYNGAHSGYVLAKSPQEITVKEIAEIVEGNFDLIECVTNPSGCARAAMCATRDLWDDLGRTIAEKLDSFTIKDLIDRSKEKQENSTAYNI